MAPTTDPPQGKAQSAPGPITKEPSTSMNGHNDNRQPIPGNAPRNGKPPLVPRRRDARPAPSMRQFSRPAVTANAVHGSPFDEDVLPATHSQSRTWVKPKVDSGGGDKIPTGPSRPVVPQTAHSRTALHVAPWTHTIGDMGKNNATSATPSRPSAASPVASRAESALTKRHEPHIYLSSDRVPVKDYIHERLKAHYKGYGCQDVLRGPAGFYITFPDTSEGRTRLVKCAQKSKNDVVYQFSLRSRVFYKNKEVKDLRKLTDPTAAKRSRSSSPDLSIVCGAAKPLTPNTQRGRGISSDALAQSLTPRPRPTSPGISTLGRAAKSPITTNTHRDPDSSSNALAQSFTPRPRPPSQGISILCQAAKPTTTTKAQQESDSSSGPPVQSFTPRPLSSSPPASPRPGHEQTSSGPKVTQSIINGVEREELSDKVTHSVTTEAGEEEANTKVLQGVVAEVGVEASRTNIPSLVKHIPKHPLDDSSSMASGTSASSRSKSAKCRVCNGLGGALSVCPTCSRHYHKHCRPSGCRPETADMHWQCESCVKRGVPSARKVTGSVTTVTGIASAPTGLDRSVVNSWPSEEHPTGEEAQGAKVTRARAKSKAEDEAKAETTNSNKGPCYTAVDTMLITLQESSKARIEARPANVDKIQLKRKADADGEGPIKKVRINDLGVRGVVDSKEAIDEASASLRTESQSAIPAPKRRADPLQDRPSSSQDAEEDLLSKAQNLVDQSFAATEAVTDERRSAGPKKPSFKRVRRANTSVHGSREKQTQQFSETHNLVQGIPTGPATLHSLSASFSGTSKATYSLKRGIPSPVSETLNDGKTAHQPSAKFIAKLPQHSAPASLPEKVSLQSNTIQPPTTRSGRNRAQRTKIRSMPCSGCGKKSVPYHISGKAKCSACKSKPDVLTTPAQTSGLQEDAVPSAQALVEGQDVTRHDSARDSEGETRELRGPEGDSKADELVKPLDRSAKENPVDAFTTSSGIDFTKPGEVAPSDQQPSDGVTAEADDNEPALEQSDTDSELTELTDDISSPSPGSGATSEIDLGDSLQRPNGTYHHLIGMALLDIPDNWATVPEITQWIANNIPGYELTYPKCKWASSVQVTLGTNARGRNGPRIVRARPLPGQTGPLNAQKKAYALLPGLEDTLLRWDATLQRPVRPSNGPLKQRKTVVAALEEAAIPNAEGIPQQPTQRHAEADAEEDAAMLDCSDGLVPARPGYTVSSTKARVSTEENVPEDNKPVAGGQHPRASALERFPASAFAPPAVESGQDNQDTRTEYERVFGPPAPVLPAAYRWRLEPTATWDPDDEAIMLKMHRADRVQRQREKPSMSLFADRPRLDPDFEKRQQAKVEEIALRREKQRADREERRRQGKPYSKSGSCAAPHSPLDTNFSRRPPSRADDNATYQDDDELDAFVGLRDDVNASLDETTGELLYTTADGKVYRTGSFA